jgi:hypothetical protein
MSINPVLYDIDPTQSILKIGGKVIDFVEWSNDYSGAMEAGTFRCSIDAPVADWPWWAQQTEILVDVYAGTPADPQSYSTDELTNLMTVRCDQIELNPETQLIELEGRDLTSLLIDNKTTDKWPNKTSSQIAALIAAKMGLQTNIQATTGKVGNFYTADHVKLAKAETYWNILTYLAQHEDGFQVHVLGKTLFFGQFAAKASLDPYLITFVPSSAALPIPESNAKHLKFSRDLTLAQDISVTVRSYHGYKGASFKATATATKTAKKIEKDAELAQVIQKYDYTIPGLTQPQCALKAQELLGQISRHELKMHAELPFDTILYPWVPVKVEGTNTVWDATYTPLNVSRTFSKDHVSMNIKGVTGIPQQTVVLS